MSPLLVGYDEAAAVKRWKLEHGAEIEAAKTDDLPHAQVGRGTFLQPIRRSPDRCAVRFCPLGSGAERITPAGFVVSYCPDHARDAWHLFGEAASGRMPGR